MESLWQDVRYALRALLRNRGFTAVAVVTLALGIGANAAIFTTVEAALLRPLPYRDAQRLIQVWESTPTQPTRQLSYPDFLDVRERGRGFAGVAGYAFDGYDLAGADGPERVAAARVSHDFFTVLGIAPLLGRSFSAGEDQVDRRRDVVLLTHGLWQRRFGADPSLVGQSLTLSGTPMTVIGVLPPEFHFAPLGTPQLFVTLSPNPQAAERRYMHWMFALARLAPETTPEQTRAELLRIAGDRGREDERWHAGTSLAAVPLREVVTGRIQPLLLGLFGAVAAVLLIACANVANMLLARATSRQREVAVRIALGASRGRLVRQFLTESLLLACLGGGAGLLWAGWGVSAMVAAIPPAQLQSLPFLTNLELHPGVLGFTFAVCVLTGVLFGILPALRSARSMSQGIRDGVRVASGRGALRQALVVSELAMAVVLVASSVLLAQSLTRLLRVDPGFRTENLLTLRVAVPASRYDSNEKAAQYFDQLRARLVALPGVAGAALVDRLPMTGFGSTGIPSVVGRPPAGANAPQAQMRTVSREYFEVMGIRLLAGRAFAPEDARASSPPVIVNDAFRAQILGNQDPIGQRLTFVFSGDRQFEIVGVVADENVGSLDEVARPVMYSSFQGGDAMNLLVRGRDDVRHLIGAVRGAARELEPETVLSGIRSMDELIAGSPATFLRRYPLLIVGSFAGLALLLACVGIYGVVSYSVTQRTREFGVRIALGAQRGDVLRLVLNQGLALTAGGLAVGLLGSLLVARVLKAYLFGVAPGDPWALSATACLLASVATLACLVPALRATRVDPCQALRHD